MSMIDVVHRATIADGLAGGGDEGAITNELIAKAGVELILIPEVEIRRAVREVAETSGLVIEGSAAASFAAIAADRVNDSTSQIGFISSGRNISHELFVELMREPLV
jgi:threonine dehydratase